MFRLSQGLRSLAWLQQRKLFLLVFIWTCLCLVLFRSAFLPSPGDEPAAAAASLLQAAPHEGAARVAAKRAASSLRPLISASQNTQQRAQTNVIESTSERRQQVISTSTQSQASLFAAPPPPVVVVAAQAHFHDHERATTTSETSFKQQHLHKTSSKLLADGLMCAYEPPGLIDLQFNNIYWQKFTTRHAPPANLSAATIIAKLTQNANQFELEQLQKQANYYLYSAYYDNRWRAGLPSVRLLAMIDRVQPPPTNCLLWSTQLRWPSSSPAAGKLRPLITRASFVYAWYPKWGNYEDGLLQPWIVTCPLPRDHLDLVPDSVSLVELPLEAMSAPDGHEGRRKRQVAVANGSSMPSASIAMPPAYSSSSSSSNQLAGGGGEEMSPLDVVGGQDTTQPMRNDNNNEEAAINYDCKSTMPITNNLPVLNRRPEKREKFAVCVKGLDFPHEDVSVRLVEWIELLNVLGAKKIFLYVLAVHKNVSRVLEYYEARGLVELNHLTLPGDQPNLPDYQHAYLKQRLTTKRQNELIPYNDCLYRNLYSYEYLALLDIDEIIMPLKANQNNWYDLMAEVERVSLAEQNYSRASYNVRNVYFFDDLSGPLGTTAINQLASSSSPSSNQNNNLQTVADSEQDDETNPEDSEDSSSSSTSSDNSMMSSSTTARNSDSAERGIPHYLHMMSHVYRSKNYTEPGQYVKCFHNTERVVSLHNHFPMNCFGQCTTYSIPVHLAHLQHYRKDCVGPLRQSCKNDFRHFTTRDTTIWRHKQRIIKRTTRVLNALNLLTNPSGASAFNHHHEINNHL